MANKLKGIFITGTDTGVGKTHVACQLARQLIDDGFTVIPRKPIESGCDLSGPEPVIADAQALKQASNYPQPISTVCPYPLQAAISPAEAARLENKAITLNQLIEACEIKPDDPSQKSKVIRLIEGAGGFYSPLCEDALNADLAQKLNFPVVLVANDKLGCINHILLSIEAIKARNLNIIAVVLNQIEPTNTPMNNAKELSQLISEPIIQVSQLKSATFPPQVLITL